MDTDRRAYFRMWLNSSFVFVTSFFRLLREATHWARYFEKSAPAEKKRPESRSTNLVFYVAHRNTESYTRIIQYCASQLEPVRELEHTMCDVNVHAQQTTSQAAGHLSILTVASVQLHIVLHRGVDVRSQTIHRMMCALWNRGTISPLGEQRRDAAIYAFVRAPRNTPVWMCRVANG